MVMVSPVPTARDEANRRAYDAIVGSEPVLVDVVRLREAVPDYPANLILTSGPPAPFEAFDGGQRDAVIYGALFEGLASDVDDAARKLERGEILVGACHDWGCIGSLAGIYTASMPVFVVENQPFGTRGYCNFYEGENPRRLNYGCWGEDVKANLMFIEEVMAPVIGEAVREIGGVPLKPLIRRALHMGDELHSRNTAATLLFQRAITPGLLTVARNRLDDVTKVLEFLGEADYSFLRLSMAAGKCTADAAHGIEGSSVVSAIALSCRGASIRVSGLSKAWFEGPPPTLEGKLFDGFTEEDIVWMGGESTINETVGLGGFAQAAAFPLQAYQGGSAEVMVARNLEMYEITVGEHEEYRIPYMGYRGVPVGIDIFKVLSTGIRPLADIGVAGRGGGQIGAGVCRMPIEIFRDAAKAYEERYGPAAS